MMIQVAGLKNSVPPFRVLNLWHPHIVTVGVLASEG